MKKITTSIICLLLLIVSDLKAQVWFPEGEYNLPQPVAFTIDNQQIFTISKYFEDTTKSYWVVAKYDGKTWTTLPGLLLNYRAEVLQIKAYNGSLYVGGNFTFDNGAFSSLVKFNGVSWGGVTKFKRNVQTPTTINALEVFNKKLIIGGNFNSVALSKDSLPYLIAYNGTDFSSVFNNCKNCFPNGPVLDLAVDDTLLAISGVFSIMKAKKSQYLFLHNLNERFDTFINTPAIIDKLAIKGKIIVGSGISTNKERKIFKILGGSNFTDLKLNLDSVPIVNKIEWFETDFWMNGVAYLKGSSGLKSTTLKLSTLNSLWTDFSNNYPGAKSIATGRGALWAIGNANKSLSIWNANKHVVRFFPNSALVTVKVFLDSTNDCIQQKFERPMPKQLVKVTLPLVNRYALTNEAGMTEFLFNTPVLKVPFTITLPRNHNISTCSSDSIFKLFNEKHYLDSIVFPVNRRTNINDVKIILSAPKGTQVVKNKRTEYVVTCENVGSNIVSGQVQLKKNKHLNSSDYSLDGLIGYTDSTAQWSYVNLKPGTKKTYTYSGVAYDTSFTDNTILQAQASASIAGSSNDYPDDDADSIDQIVDNTVDPFRKDVYPIPNPGDSISYLSLADRQLRYNISFSNFSAAIVNSAIITDTLDLNLDMSYIEETGSNKSYYTEIETNINNPYQAIIIWHFPNINLPANPTKNFENTASSSYIGFKVVMKPISNGYILKNMASVFFDNYYVGKTNTTYCAILNTSVVDIVDDKKGFLVYPNPVTNLLNIQLSLDPNDKITIINQQGSQVRSAVMTEKNDNYSIDVDGLSSGIYVVQVMKGNQLHYSKFVKM